MALPNIFNKDVVDKLIARINLINPSTKPSWGSMSSSQMLAHINVVYEMTFEDIHPKPNSFLKLILKYFIKNKVVDETPYKKSVKTAPQFIIKDSRDFSLEKSRLISYLNKCLELGEAHFSSRENHSFGILNAIEWNNLFYKHLDHHLRQFGV